ncbi:MAG: nucleotide exchange factor GrpE [Termitinemataceae bacterium]|nr:MAG: nucleotide exchange factor GrpE [Termitinemataceae bacterium]
MESNENRIEDAIGTESPATDTNVADSLEDASLAKAEVEETQEEPSLESSPADVQMSDSEKIAQLEAKVAELGDQYLRKAADFDNYRKRMIKEKQDALDFANQTLIIDLIAVLDDFERALKAAEASAKTEDDFKALCEGVTMIEKRLTSDLENKWGLKRFDSVGTPFDPACHEALMMEKSGDITEATVQEEFAKGYTLKERVVRSAKVKVLMPE